jgi:hypothetical protein
MAHSQTDETKRKIGEANRGRKRPDLAAFNQTVDRRGPRPWQQKPVDQLSPFRKKRLGILLSDEETAFLKDYFAAQSRLARSTVPGKARSLYQSARSSARERNLPFDLTTLWIEERLNNGVCEVSGLPFSMTVGGGHLTCGAGNQNPFGPSLDRRESAKGYTQENVQIVVWIYNACKQTHTHADVMTLARALVANVK